MAKYDAFGREIGENTLAGLGGGSVVSPAPSATPEAPKQTSEPEGTPKPKPHPPPAQITHKRKRRGRVAVVLIAAAVIIQGLLTGSDEDTSTTSAPAGPSIVSRSNGGGSLLTTPAFAAALAKMRTANLGRPAQIRLSADRIDITSITDDGRIRVAQVNPDIEVKTITTGGRTELDTYSFDDVRPAAPQRLIRAASRRLHEPRGAVDYLFFSRLGEDEGWIVYFKDGKRASGDARGRLKLVF